MTHLLTLPIEIRCLIYKLYLQGLTLEIKQKADFDTRTDPDRWRIKFKKEGPPNVLSLTRVNRLIATELRPMIPSLTRQLFLRGNHVDDYAEPLAKIPSEFLEHIRYLSVPPVVGSTIEPEYSEVIRALPGLQLVTYRDLSVGLEEFLETDFPDHDEDWRGSALRPIVDLVNMPENFASLRRRLERHFRGFLRRNEPSFYARGYVVTVLEILGSEKGLWVRNTTYQSRRIRNANGKRTWP